MVNIVFYEKPGCINNTKQKKLLLQAGHKVEARDLMAEPWSKQQLLEFFRDMPVATWFNMSAPDIKSERIAPSSLDEEEALELMIRNPILIRRPLMRVANECRVGFDAVKVDQWIGLIDASVKENLESCPRTTDQSCSTS